MIDFDAIQRDLPGGYTLVESYHGPERTVVLAKRSHPVFEGCEYTTWEWSDTVGLFWGHYDLSQESGHRDFLRRCE